LLATEGVNLQFTRDGLSRIAEISWQVNERTENIGARRLHTVLEKLLEDVSFEAADRNGHSIVIDGAYVDAHLGELAMDEDLSRYIL
jgi:ATP-dependent HslUV protease ATP-binding subunit HslU